MSDWTIWQCVLTQLLSRNIGHLPLLRVTHWAGHGGWLRRVCALRVPGTLIWQSRNRDWWHHGFRGSDMPGRNGVAAVHQSWRGTTSTSGFRRVRRVRVARVVFVIFGDARNCDWCEIPRAGYRSLVMSFVAACLPNSICQHTMGYIWTVVTSEQLPSSSWYGKYEVKSLASNNM